MRKLVCSFANLIEQVEPITNFLIPCYFIHVQSLCFTVLANCELELHLMLPGRPSPNTSCFLSLHPTFNHVVSPFPQWTKTAQKVNKLNAGRAILTVSGEGHDTVLKFHCGCEYRPCITLIRCIATEWLDLSYSLIHITHTHVWWSARLWDPTYIGYCLNNHAAQTGKSTFKSKNVPVYIHVDISWFSAFGLVFSRPY